jgi:hypothetical protein
MYCRRTGKTVQDSAGSPYFPPVCFKTIKHVYFMIHYFNNLKHSIKYGHYVMLTAVRRPILLTFYVFMVVR